MSRNKPDKKISAIEASFENILVCNNKNLRPFVEIFVAEPENITQKNLGSLMGIFEVADTSEDSSYIVNYLSSVIKKEYFSKPKRPPIESFEAALHKANLALSKLAEHGNVKWIGKLNALIAIIEKNNLHISQAGAASAFLLRAKSMTDISEGLSDGGTEPHPLKTFVNVSSGRLEIGDKLIVATESIFEIFSSEEIKKSALRFPGEKFIQFLKTALGNELEKAAVLVVDIKEKEETEPAAALKKNSVAINAFSQAAFFKEPASQANKQSKENISLEITKEINKEIQQGQPEFINEKNGHIYIKETAEESLAKPQSEYFIAISERASAIGQNLKKFSKNSGHLLLETAKKVSLPKIKLPKANYQKQAAVQAQTEEKIAQTPKKITEKKTPSFSLVPLFSVLQTKIINVFNDKNKKVARSALTAAKESLLKFASVLAPNFSRIKKIALRLDRQQRIYAALIVFAIVFAPLTFFEVSNYFKHKQAAKNTPVQEIIIPLEQDKNVVRIDKLATEKTLGDSASGIVNLNGKIFAVSESSISSISDGYSSAIPAEFGKAKISTGMDDLNLIFFINDSGKIISFSPASKKFQNNNLELAERDNIAAIGTYLTYLYAIDARNSQIYRYPRAEGGFGAKNDWLKSPVDLAGTTDMALSDNIFITNNNSVIKLFKGKKQDFNIESTATPIIPFKVFTQPDSQNIFVLDKQNSRVIKLDLNGSIQAQYYNSEIANAADFAINETTNNAYILTSNNIFSFNLN